MTDATSITQQHRAQQLVIRQATVRQLTAIWPLLDWTRLDDTYPKFALSVAGIVNRNRATSNGLASQYLRAFRRASGVLGEVRTVLAEPVGAKQLGASLRSTTVAPIKAAAGRGVEQQVAMGNGLTLAQGMVARLVLNGMRDTILSTINEDSAAVGWQRVLGGSGCDFCAMLADRGAVYKEETVDFASHDHCGCSVAPSYGDTPKTVSAYTPSARTITDRDRARVRSYLRDNPRA